MVKVYLIFFLGNTPNGYFTIVSTHSGKVLDASMENQVDVVLWDYHGGDSDRKPGVLVFLGFFALKTPGYSGFFK